MEEDCRSEWDSSGRAVDVSASGRVRDFGRLNAEVTFKKDDLSDADVCRVDRSRNEVDEASCSGELVD